MNALEGNRPESLSNVWLKRGLANYILPTNRSKNVLLYLSMFSSICISFTSNADLVIGRWSTNSAKKWWRKSRHSGPTYHIRQDIYIFIISNIHDIVYLQLSNGQCKCICDLKLNMDSLIVGVDQSWLKALKSKFIWNRQFDIGNIIAHHTKNLHHEISVTMLRAKFQMWVNVIIPPPPILSSMLIRYLCVSANFKCIPRFLVKLDELMINLTILTNVIMHSLYRVNILRDNNNWFPLLERFLRRRHINKYERRSVQLR